jgi:hypothetical protein
LEEHLSPPTNETKANYTNLPSAYYSFIVKSSNIYGIESQLDTYQFTISPPWYETKWYYFGQFSFLGILVFFTVYLNRSKRDTEYAAIVTFIALITIFEFLIFLLDPLINKYTDGVSVFQLLMNIILAASLYPVKYWVRGVLKKK